VQQHQLQQKRKQLSTIIVANQQKKSCPEWNIYHE